MAKIFSTGAAEQCKGGPVRKEGVGCPGNKILGPKLGAKTSDPGGLWVVQMANAQCC